MNIRLRRPTDDEYTAWADAELDGYIDAIVASGGLPRGEAEETARRENADVLPDGLNSPDQLIFRVDVEDQPVGWLWLSLRHPRGIEGIGWIYNIVVDEPYRGRGYGRATMALAEQEASRNGLSAIALNVFGDNTVARSLYSKLGYREIAVQMIKELKA